MALTPASAWRVTRQRRSDRLRLWTVVSAIGHVHGFYGAVYYD
jgi:hypothetical protein